MLELLRILLPTLTALLHVRHLRAILTEFVRYYNHDRPHRTLGLQPPAPEPQSHYGAVTVRPVLGGLHHVYQRAA
jgi:putative transposase